MSRRTTVTLEDDVAGRLEEEARRTGRTFKDVLNDTVRRGLDEALRPGDVEFQVEASDMGLRPGLSIDHISGLLEQLDGPGYR